MNIKKLIKTATTVAASASVIDALVKNGKKVIDKNCEKIVIYYPWVDHSNFLHRIIPIMEYLYKYDKDIYKNFDVFMMQLENDRYNRKDQIRKETFDKMMYGPSNSTKLIRITKKDFVILIFQSHGQSDDRYENTAGSLTIQMVGPNRKKIKKKLEKIALNNGQLDSYSRTEESGWIRLDRNMNRSMETIYSHQKYEILNAIETYEKNSSIMKKLGRKNKFVMLMYGKPGTGKSSMIEALGNHLKRHLRIFGPEISINSLLTTVTNGEFAIYVLEEVDLFFESDSNANSSDNPSSTGNSIQGGANPSGKLSVLLQILDGLYTRENLFFIMTTNHVDKLDERLTRGGRVDLMIEMTGLNESLARVYCKDMGLTDEQTDKVLEEVNDHDRNTYNNYNQAELERAVMKLL